MISRELVAASTRPLVLAILARGESYGYAIIQEIRERSGGELTWTEGMLYPVLHRLEERDLIVARWGKSETGRRRKYYRLSDDGGRALSEEMTKWTLIDGLLRSAWGETGKTDEGTTWGETRCAL
jgi:PadR family transcriptional regulator PadR